MISELHGSMRSGTALAAAALAVSCLVTAIRAYPFSFPYINPLSQGRPAYALVNDSNVDWNQSLPEVERFAEQHGLQKIELDEYGFSDLNDIRAPGAALELSKANTGRRRTVGRGFLKHDPRRAQL